MEKSNFGSRLQEYFTERKISNADLSRRLNNYSQMMISRAFKSDAPVVPFLTRVVEEFPDIDLNYVFKGSEKQEPSELTIDQLCDRGMDIFNELKQRMSRP